ncbi:HD domain-containing protein [Candidatus Micrarchaeota archaeon]|nr:HD domain-containing protein [Candidatus Micrarchaeota archaeon]
MLAPENLAQYWTCYLGSADYEKTKRKVEELEKKHLSIKNEPASKHPLSKQEQAISKHIQTIAPKAHPLTGQKVSVEKQFMLELSRHLKDEKRFMEYLAPYATKFDPDALYDPAIDAPSEHYKMRAKVAGMLADCYGNLNRLESADYCIALKTSEGSAERNRADNILSLSKREIGNIKGETVTAMGDESTLHDPVIGFVAEEVEKALKKKEDKKKEPKAYEEYLSSEMTRMDAQLSDHLYAYATKSEKNGRYVLFLNGMGAIKKKYLGYDTPYDRILDMTPQEIVGLYYAQDCVTPSESNANPSDLYALVQTAYAKEQVSLEKYKCIGNEERRKSMALAFSSPIGVSAIIGGILSEEEAKNNIRQAYAYYSDLQAAEKEVRMCFRKPFFNKNAPFSSCAPYIQNNIGYFTMARLLEKDVLETPKSFGFTNKKWIGARKAVKATVGGAKDCFTGFVFGLVAKENLAIAGGTHGLIWLSNIAQKTKFAKAAPALRATSFLFATGIGVYYLLHGSADLATQWDKLDSRGKVSGACGLGAMLVTTGHSTFVSARNFYKKRAAAKAGTELKEQTAEEFGANEGQRASRLEEFNEVRFNKGEMEVDVAGITGEITSSTKTEAAVRTGFKTAEKIRQTAKANSDKTAAEITGELRKAADEHDAGNAELNDMLFKEGESGVSRFEKLIGDLKAKYGNEVGEILVVLKKELETEVEFAKTSKDPNVLKDATRAGQTYGHSLRVGELARSFTEALKKEMGTDETISSLDPVEMSGKALLHDIGKLGDHADWVLSKRKFSELSPAEKKELTLRQGSHAGGGYRAIELLCGKLAICLEKFGSAARDHHLSLPEIMNLMDSSEKLQSKRGYEALIVRIADIFDAITSERPYSAAEPTQKALDGLKISKADEAKMTPAQVKKYYDILEILSRVPLLGEYRAVR